MKYNRLSLQCQQPRIPLLWNNEVHDASDLLIEFCRQRIDTRLGVIATCSTQSHPAPETVYQCIGTLFHTHSIYFIKCAVKYEFNLLWRRFSTRKPWTINCCFAVLLPKFCNTLIRDSSIVDLEPVSMLMLQHKHDARHGIWLSCTCLVYLHEAATVCIASS